MKNLILTAAAFLVFFSIESKALELKMPTCGAVGAWVQPVQPLIKGDRDPANVEKAKQSVKDILADEKTAALYGKAYSQWSEGDKNHVWGGLVSCGTAIKDAETMQKLRYAMAVMGALPDWGTRTKKPH